MSEIRRAVVKSYDAAAHKADVQIAGSLAVWLDAVRVATNIPAADVVTGRQCTVLFLDPSNQDDAVIITIQGALPSTGELLVATATASLTLTTSAQSIVGDGDSTKVRLLLPTPGDWLIEATCDFHVTTAAAGFAAVGELFVNDSGSAEAGAAIKEQQALDRATVTQRWKVTTTAANTPVELKARKDGGAGVVVASANHTRLTALLLTGGNATSIDPSATVVTETAFGQADAAGSATPYSRGDHTHGTPADPVPAHAAIVDAHAMLAAANTWAALQTFSAGLQLAAAQAIKDSGGTARIAVSATAPFVKVTGDPTTPTRGFEVANIAASTGNAISAPGFVVDFASGKAVCLTAGGSQSVFMFDDTGAFAIQKRPRADVLLGIGATSGAVFQITADGKAGFHMGSTAPSYPLQIQGSTLPQLYIEGGGSHAQIGIVGGGGGTEKGLDYRNGGTLLWKAGIDNLPSSPDFRASYVIKHTNNANPEFAVTPGGNFIMADAGATSLPSPSTLLELQSTTAALLLTRMTTTQRNALTAINGMIIYNTTDNVVQAYENGAWVDL